MNPSDDPFSALPFAVLGLIVGVVITYACAYGGYQLWAEAARRSPASAYATHAGTIEGAAWRRSALAGGPTWYLQLRIEGDPRGFIVAASSLPRAARDRIGLPDSLSGPGRRPLPALRGRAATVTVDSSLWVQRDDPTTYLAGLRVEGETLVPVDREEPEAGPWQTGLFAFLLGAGELLGLGLTAVSGHHIFLCFQFWHRRGR